MAKKSQSGVFNLDTEDKQNRILKNINVEDIWGISRRWGSKLRMIGIGTALELRNASANRIRQYLGVVVMLILCFVLFFVHAHELKYQCDLLLRLS